jgi:glycine C-acetyltransferase
MITWITSGTGLLGLGLNIGNTQSAIFPVRVGDKIKNARICHAMQQMGVYANQINYPAVSMKDAGSGWG